MKNIRPAESIHKEMQRWRDLRTLGQVQLDIDDNVLMMKEMRLLKNKTNKRIRELFVELSLSEPERLYDDRLNLAVDFLNKVVIENYPKN